jgi:hypothetical protein
MDPTIDTLLLKLVAVETVSIMASYSMYKAPTAKRCAKQLVRGIVSSSLLVCFRRFVDSSLDCGAMYSIATTFLCVRGPVLTALIKKEKGRPW